MVEVIEILLNGSKTTVPAGRTLELLVQHLGLNREQVALELNRTIVPRGQWGACVIRPGDELEIVHFVGGGKGARDVG